MDATCPCFPSRRSTPKSSAQDFLTKSGISMFIPDVLFDPLPVVQCRWRVQRRRRRADHRRPHQSVHRQLLQGRRPALLQVRRRTTAAATSPPTPPTRWTAASISTPASRTYQSNPNSGDSFASMLLGLPSAVRRGTGNTVTEAQINVHQYYFQDDWRVNNKTDRQPRPAL